MPFLKFSRDKRGYEHFSIVEPSAGRRGKSSRPRVLFWFRTPPQIKVGREPFSEEVRRAIEAQNPGLRFDWARLLSTPIPAPDAEHWRERRRAERAARQAAREPEEADLGGAGDHVVSGESQPEERQDGLDSPERNADADDRASNDQDNGLDDGQPEGEHVPAETTLSASESERPAPVSALMSGSEPPAAGRRRRRRGRRKRHRTVESPSGPAAPNVPVPPTEEV